MPYYFECLNCNDRQETGAFTLDLEDNCVGCGTDMCKICISEDGLCDQCEREAAKTEGS